MLSKQASLEKLRKKIFKDKNLAFQESNLVFGEGSLNANLFFIGEAPGLNEDKLCRPFVGRSGKLLDQGLESINIKRENIYITNIVKRRPPENRDPSKEELEAYSYYLKKQIEIIRPKLIVSLGRFAFNYFIPNIKISQSQGKIFKLNNFLLFPIIHPSATFRSKVNYINFYKSFKKLGKIIKN